VTTPARFIGEPIEVAFDRPPLLEKKPGCPSRFTWQEQRYEVVEMVAEWHDYARRGRASRNMRPAHLAIAAQRGSWGVGRDFFRVRTDAGRTFDIYFDRAPRDAGRPSSGWFIFREVLADEAAPPGIS
jgi:hypothetical protein